MEVNGKELCTLKTTKLIGTLVLMVFVAVMFVAAISTWLNEPGECRMAYQLKKVEYSKAEISVNNIHIICSDDVEIDIDLIRNELLKMIYFDKSADGYSLTMNVYFGNEYRLDTCTVQYNKQTNQNKPEWITLSCFLYNSTTINYDQLFAKSYLALCDLSKDE